MSSRKKDTFEIPWWLITMSYLLYTVVMLAVLGLLSIAWGDLLVYTIGDLWSRSDDVIGGLMKVWFIFVWGAAFTLLVGFVFRKEPRFISPGYLFGKGLWISLNAGFFEELLYRWLRFSIALIVLPFFNLITFGLLEWLYTAVLVPVANWATFGALSEYLFHPASWVVGAAIISANGSFRDGHKGNGFIGWVNSWFIGMVLFYLMFNYGLWTAIVAHVLYDIVVFTSVAIATSWQPTSLLTRRIVRQKPS